MAYAHSRNTAGQRHDLVAHLRAVGHLTAQFADPLGARDVGYWLGLWHDLGKFDPQWQQYLLTCEAGEKVRSVDHKAAGTVLAAGRPDFGPLGLLIQGHHGGLRAASGLRDWLGDVGARPGAVEALNLARQAISDLEPVSQVKLPAEVLADSLKAEFFLRLLFSALIDADRLDTERHFTADQASIRGSDITMAELWERLERKQQELMQPTTGTDQQGRVAQVRKEIYEACIAAADEQPGLFRLAAPTGGGKTRSAMAFALRHALRHGFERVVVAVPYISITQQTAQVYRGIFGGTDEQPVVLEHHSGGHALDLEEEDFQPRAVWARLAAENWDAPIIVTTTVQLFESLFASSTSATRKVHRLARSVIILDEAQALPPHLLDPILDGLRQLCETYRSTVVVSTATQPAFEVIPAFAAAVGTEIVAEARRHFEQLKRVHYEWQIEPGLDWAEVASLMRSEPRALAILNTRPDAMAVLDALDDPDALHLSTLLCGAHRLKVIEEVKRRLAAAEPCRLVSTQVVEAGVDIDFPLVLRALGPLDSVIQAAGRCNREGKLDRGRVVVFRPTEGRLPKGAYSMGCDVTRALLGTGNLDPDNPDDARRYFERWFQTLGPDGVDRERIQERRGRLDYPEVARRFRMIGDVTESVVITDYGTAGERRLVQRTLDRLGGAAPDARRLLRVLQPFIVSIRRWEADRHRSNRFIGEPLLPDVSVWLGSYHPVRGLTAVDEPWIV
jgi:CRISPR-associated endonuclease/helicase Cas3